jgi:L-fucose dehydrogenase
MNLELKDKVVIVTGGARGIGQSIVQTLAANHAVPVVFDRTPESEAAWFQELKAEHKRAEWEQVELTDEKAVANAVDIASRHFGRLDGLINNAGSNDGSSLRAKPARFRKSLEQNLVQCFTVTHHAVPHLKSAADTHGEAFIINIGSKAAIAGHGHASGYSAAKGGLLALTREWAVALVTDKIRVNAVVPAEVWTPMYDGWFQSRPDPDAERREVEARIPLGRRMTEPREIADTVVFLASPRTSHTTGQILFIDGGYTHLDRAFS